MRRINFLLRWLGTALSFALFFVGGLLQGFLIHPLIWLLVRNAERRRRLSRRVVGMSMSLFVWTMKVLGVLDYEITGRQYIDPEENYLILANHPSLIDVVFLLSIFPHADCVVKSAMARSPFFFALIRSAGYISNSDSVAMLYHATEQLQAGNSLIVFPEGTRTGAGSDIQFSRGAAAIAVRAECECLPVFISCEPTTLTRQDHWYQIPDHKVNFRAAIQPPLNVSRWTEEPADRRAMTERINSRLQTYFVDGLAEIAGRGSS